MPLMLVCPCGHSAPLPEESIRVRCTRCQRRLEFRLFEGPRAYDQWHAWMIAHAFTTPRAERASVKFFVTSQNEEQAGECPAQ